MPLVSTKGAASAQGFGLTLGGEEPNYIEDVFSTWLYTGNDSTQTITNGIDLAGEGGMVWVKGRDIATDNSIVDTVRGVNKNLLTNQNYAQNTDPSVSAFNSNGFSINSVYSFINDTGYNYASWTFRKAPKFFDVVTYTGNGTYGRALSHSLGSVPGCIIVKRTSGTSNWGVFHQSLGSSVALQLNTTAASAAFGYFSGDPTTSDFFVTNTMNASGSTYVAYLFAHNAGGFGLTGTDNVISCGSFNTGASGGATVDLGYEPQWLLIKSSSNTSPWYLFDTMRGWVVASESKGLSPNNANAEFNFGNASLPTNPTATGFTFSNGLFAADQNWVYIAIRRGPMRTPTTGTSVFATDTLGGSSGGTAVPAYRAPFPVDFAFEKRTNAADNWIVNDRLRGINSLNFNLSAAEALYDAEYKMDFMNGWVNYTGSNSQYRSWMMRRAPGFFDEVCYTGTGVAGRTVTHNLTVAPELIITKNRSNGARGWAVLNPNGRVSFLNQNGQEESAAITPFFFGNNTIAVAPTATNFTVGTDANTSAENYVAYLFASCPGVSKVGSYTGTGTTQVINCGFTAGSRFVLIKRTDSTGDWYVWDSARGIVAGNDPYLLLNSTAAEVTNTDFIDTAATGFEISSTAPAAINASGGTYIFLAIA